MTSISLSAFRPSPPFDPFPHFQDYQLALQSIPPIAFTDVAQSFAPILHVKIMLGSRNKHRVSIRASFLKAQIRNRFAVREHFNRSQQRLHQFRGKHDIGPDDRIERVGSQIVSSDG